MKSKKFSQSQQVAAAGERLQKVLARAGVASRRASEELIVAGRVSVNGKIVRELGVRVDPQRDQIRVDGEPVRLKPALHYIALHKPIGVLSSTQREAGQNLQTVIDLVPPARHARLFPVGRLDVNSEGLILLTNDGDLTYHLTHPRFEHPKTYLALVTGQVERDALQMLRQGVGLEDGMTAPAQVSVLPAVPSELRLASLPGMRGVWVRVVVHEGRQHQVRRMLEAVGHPVLRLVRIGIGPLSLGHLAPGEWRPLRTEEIRQLQKIYRTSTQKRRS